MIIPKLAFQNILGAGLRTWLNVIVLSFVYVTIIGLNGIYGGMQEQAVQAQIDVEYGGGQFWQQQYDPYDPFSFQDAHGLLPQRLQNWIGQGTATPILMTQATIYPNGRIRTILLKGIDPEQTILNIPSHFLNEEGDMTPALIGSRMAKSTGLNLGDYVTVRWRDKNGTFDAQDVEIVQIMNTSVQTVDNNQIWIPLNDLQEMTQMQGEATIVVVDRDFQNRESIEGWPFQSLDVLLKDLMDMVKSKTIGGSIVYIVLLMLAVLAIFDTQVLSIFKRRKEMGTLMALGMTRFKVIQLFTLEGAVHGVLAVLVAAIYGVPLLVYLATRGFPLPASADSYGFAIGERLFPIYSAQLVFGTIVLVMVITTIVSYLPTRKISKLKPTDALKGKLT
ncbi:FtsX-like permease family protein [bacterium]|nr:FtsX-like permease family protein [bacterium]